MSIANVLTAEITAYLNATGFVVWRQNSVGKTAGRFLSVKKGVSDIVGYEKGTGKFIAVEVKIGKDKLTDFQIEFLLGLSKNNCFAIVANNFEQFLGELVLYHEKFKQTKTK